MPTTEICNEQFEKDCLSQFEKLLQGYRKASQSSVWESDLDALVKKLTHLPTAPFPCQLMKLFDYNYLVLSESIDSIIEKTLVIREQMEHTQRYVTIKERYFSFPYLPPNTYLKRLEVYNNNGELCYLQAGKMRPSLVKLLKWIKRGSKKVELQHVFTFKQKLTQCKQLEIYYYSPYVDLSSTDPKDYYAFFTDYYGKIQFKKYINSKEKASTSPSLIEGNTPGAFEKVLKLTSSQQVLWAYFFFRLIGLNLRVNLEVAILTRFLHVVNNIDVDDYRNSYYYKLVSKAPYVKEDKNLLIDLETIRVHFKERNLPTGDIEKEILNVIAN